MNPRHHLLIDVRQALYSRRYDLDQLTAWLEARGYAVERIEKVADSRRVDRVAHLLLRREG